MASVISSSVLEDSAQADGRRYVRYQYTLEDNRTVQHIINFDRGLVEPGFNTETDRTARGGEVLESHLRVDDERLMDRVAQGDGLTPLLNPQWTTFRRNSQFLIRWMMRNKDPRVAIWLEPLITHLRANYTSIQRAVFLNVTLLQLAAIDQKANRILEVPATATSAKQLINLYIADSQDIE